MLDSCETCRDPLFDRCRTEALIDQGLQTSPSSLGTLVKLILVLHCVSFENSAAATSFAYFPQSYTSYSHSGVVWSTIVAAGPTSEVSQITKSILSGFKMPTRSSGADQNEIDANICRLRWTRAQIG